MSRAETGAVSRLPRTNSTDRRRTAVSVTSGVELRDELRRDFVDRGPNVVDWGTAVEEWRKYIGETAGTSLIFENTEGDRVYAENVHRWSEEYRERRYARMKDMERGIEDFYGRPHTALLSLTASSDEVPYPVDHLEQVLEGRAAALEALRRSLSDRTWDYWWTLEPHESGYVHLHIAVVAEGRLDASDVRPAVDAHLRQVSAAGAEAHTTQDSITLRSGDEIENLAAYLNSYLGDYEEDPLEAPEKWQEAWALMWATGRRQTGASKRLRGFMQFDGETPPEGEWSLVAVVDSDGDEHPVDAWAPGSVDRFAVEISYG